MSFSEILYIVTTMLSGLALFLFGMDTMSDSFGKMTGGTLDRLMGLITKNRYTAFLFGTILTALAQSSSAITVLSVGLVNSGIIALEQAVGLIIGANLGTTATSWLLSLNAISNASLILTLIKPSTISPFLAIIGIALSMFARSEKLKLSGSALLGFSVMMIGMNLMSQGVAPLRALPALQDILLKFSNPLLGYLTALLITMLIQSSDATVGIIQAFALSVSISFGAAIPLICGAQTGTCITSIISSIGSSNNGKRTACLNLYYNLFKTLGFLVIFYALNSVFHFSFLALSVGAVGIPLFHTLLNVAGSLICLPGGSLLVAAVYRTIPLNEEEKEAQANVLTMLDPILLSTPTFALEQAFRAVQMLAETAGSAFSTLTGFQSNPDFEREVLLLCRRCGEYADQIEHFLTQLSTQSIQESEAAMLALLMRTSASFRQISMLTKETLERGQDLFHYEGEIPEIIQTELTVFASSINDILEITKTGFKNRNPKISVTIQLYREVISEMSSLVNLRHIRQMHQSGTDQQLNSRLLDICYTEERLINCCDWVAGALLRYSGVTGGDMEFPQADDPEKAQMVKDLFRDKYRLLKLDEPES